MNLISRRTVLQTAAAGVATLAMPGILSAQSKPLRIGVLLPLSGPHAIYSPDLQGGAEIAAKEINAAGGVEGRQIELIFRDDKASANAAVEGARELAGSGVNLFVGGLHTITALSMTGIMPDLKRVLISCGAVGDPLTHESYNRNYFRVTDSSYIRSHAQALVAANKYGDVLNWGAAIPDIESGHSGWNAFKHGLNQFYPKVTGKQPNLLDPVLTKFGGTDFKNAIIALTNSPVEAIYIGVGGGDFITFVLQAKAFGLFDKLKAIMDLSGELLYAKSLKERLPQNFWSATHWYYGDYQDNPLGAGLYKAAVERGNDPAPSGYFGPTHQAIYAYAHAIRTAKSDETEAVITALEGATFDTCKGPVTFRKEDHQAISDVNLLKLGPTDVDPKWKVLDSVKMAGSEVIEPATPGQALKYPS